MTIQKEVREFLSHLRVERNLSDNTLKAYTRDLERYSEFLLNHQIDRVSAISEEIVSSYHSVIHDSKLGLATTSIARMLASVRGFHRFAIREKWVTFDATTNLVSVKPALRLPKALTIDETTRLVEALAAAEQPLQIRDYALIELLYSTGARISEAVTLSLSDINESDSSIRLTGKGGKTRVVPIGGNALQALQKYLVRVRPGLLSGSTNVVFLTRSGEPLSRQSAFNAVKHAAALAKITKQVSPHTLRHCYATHLLEGGADVRIVQELLGHNSVTTTQIYTLVTAQRLREVYATSHPRALSKD